MIANNNQDRYIDNKIAAVMNEVKLTSGYVGECLERPIHEISIN